MLIERIWLLFNDLPVEWVSDYAAGSGGNGTKRGAMSNPSYLAWMHWHKSRSNARELIDSKAGPPFWACARGTIITECTVNEQAINMVAWPVRPSVISSWSANVSHNGHNLLNRSLLGSLRPPTAMAKRAKRVKSNGIQWANVPEPEPEPLCPRSPVKLTEPSECACLQGTNHFRISKWAREKVQCIQESNDSICATRDVALKEKYLSD